MESVTQRLADMWSWRSLPDGRVYERGCLTKTKRRGRGEKGKEEKKKCVRFSVFARIPMMYVCRYVGMYVCRYVCRYLLGTS